MAEDTLHLLQAVDPTLLTAVVRSISYAFKGTTAK
jgi:hypothetical protein